VAIAMRTMVRLHPCRLVVVWLLIPVMLSRVGLGGFNGSLVVDMKNMGAFAYKEDDQTVTFGPVCPPNLSGRTHTNLTILCRVTFSGTSPRSYNPSAGSWHTAK
jgi:hypothetical protein